MRALLPFKAVSVSLSAAVVAGSLVGFAFSEEPASPPPPVAVAETMRSPLPGGSTERGAAGVETTALRLAAALDAVPVREGGDEATRFCPKERLRVRWVAPVEGEFSVGGHVSPVGPAPVDTTEEVNGLVVCENEPYAYMGFEARWDGAAWSVAAVPSLSDEHHLDEHAHEEEGEAHEEEAHDEHGHEEHGRDEHEHEEEAHEHEAPAQAHVPAKPAPKPAAPAPAAARGFSTPSSSGIEGYASYDPQRVCDPTPKPGTTALKNLLMGTYPGTRNLGVSRTCTARGVSEHKEGRAFDWGVNVGVASERAAAERVMAQLLATDAAGNRHALARRLGVMYVIWDKRIWSAYSATRGWRPYGGANPHTDHVHLSLSWAGAMGRTSYWQGSNATLLTFDPELQLVGGSGGPTGTGAASGSDGSARDSEPRASRRREDEGEQERPSRTGRRERDALRHEEDEARREYAGAGLQGVPLDEAALAEQRAAHEVRKAAERAAREAAKLAHEQAREAKKAAHEARKAAERQAHEAGKAAQRQAREAATAAARQQGQERAGQAQAAAAARKAEAKRTAETKRTAEAKRTAAAARKAEAKNKAKAKTKVKAERSAKAGGGKEAKKGGKGRG